MHIFLRNKSHKLPLLKNWYIYNAIYSVKCFCFSPLWFFPFRKTPLTIQNCLADHFPVGENDLVETWLYEVGPFHYIVVLSIGIFPGERGGVGGMTLWQFHFAKMTGIMKNMELKDTKKSICLRSFEVYVKKINLKCHWKSGGAWPCSYTNDVIDLSP